MPASHRSTHLDPQSGIRITERFVQSTLAMAVVSLDGRLLEVNPSWGRLTGCEPEALRGAAFGDLLPAAADVAEVEGVLAAARDGSRVGDVAVVLRAGDGRAVHVLATWSLLRDPDGAPWYLTCVLVDQTERVHAEQALAASEARWRTLLLQATDVTWTADDEGVATFVTPGVRAQYGWSEDDVVGRPIADLLHPEDREAFTSAWEALRTGRSATASLELRLLHPDDRTWSWVRLTVTDLRDDPHVAAIAGNVVDVSVLRREAESRLRYIERFRSRFENSRLPQAVVDPDGTFGAVNQAYCRLLGRTEAELLGEHVRSVAHPDDVDDERLKALLSGEIEWYQAERLLADADGRPVQVQVDVALLRDEQGQPSGAAAFVHDLTAQRASELRSRRQQELYDALNGLASELAIVMDPQSRIVYASPALFRVFGYDDDEVLDVEGFDFVHPDDQAVGQDLLDRVLRQGGTQHAILRIRTASGEWRWVEETASNQLHTGVGGIVCNLRDITERVQAEQALRASEARYRAIADTAEEGIWAVSPTGRTLYANARLATILGLTLDEVYARSAPSLLSPEQAEQMVERLAQRVALGPDRYEIAYDHPDGSVRRLWIAASPLRHEDGTVEGSLGMVSDVTEARRAEEELRLAALHDSLTGLPNRALAFDRLEHALRRSPSATAVLLIDLDQFKLVNDSRGHSAGDDLLVAVGERLRTASGPYDTVARLGGDEFVVVCEDIDAQEAHLRAEELLAALVQPVELTSGTVHVGASIGVAHGTGGSAEDLLRYADTAMYAAKGAGRGQVRVFDQSLAEEVEQRYALAGDLRAALADDGLQVHFQPVVDLQNGRVVGVEALSRWQHPVHGAVPPSLFVASAELTGFAPELDRWVLRRALAEAGALRRNGALPSDAHVAVNLSARSLARTGLEAEAVLAASDAGLAPSDVVLEITESAIMQDPAAAVTLLRRLRGHGFGVAVDDFGTGYSSLSYLRDLPITALKIDRSFIKDIVEDEDALAIAASVVDLARAIGVTAVAEGVEHAGQVELLRRLGCRTAQGWLWCPALPPAEAARTGAWTRTYDVAPADGPARVTAPRPERNVVTDEHGRHRMLALHREGASLATIAAALNREGFRTPTGLRWHRTSVARAVADAAYPALGGRS